MFIQTTAGETAIEMDFFPGTAVCDKAPLSIKKEDAAEKSPLAAKLYDVDGVTDVVLLEDAIRITRAEGFDWETLRTEIFTAIMMHFQSGEAAYIEIDGADEFDAELVAQIVDLLETRIVPAVTQSGGDVAYHSFEKGILYLKMQGSAFSMLTGITNMLKHYVPEITAIRDHRESLPRPGLHSEAGVAIRELLQDRINPSIAGHGGHITLMDVQESKAFVRLEGGCQGCGMADVTLKQGVAKEIMELVPTITEVLDVTDHAGGENPYYQPS